jgi:hypothetical protein
MKFGLLYIEKVNNIILARLTETIHIGGGSDGTRTNLTWRKNTREKV